MHPTTGNSFLHEFSVDDILFESFIDYSVENNIRLDFYEVEALLKQYLKASLAQQLFSPNLHAAIKANADPMLQKSPGIRSAHLQAGRRCPA